jgi:hypothetical protein
MLGDLLVDLKLNSFEKTIDYNDGQLKFQPVVLTNDPVSTVNSTTESESQIDSVEFNETDDPNRFSIGWYNTGRLGDYVDEFIELIPGNKEIYSTDSPLTTHVESPKYVHDLSNEDVSCDLYSVEETPYTTHLAIPLNIVPEISTVSEHLIFNSFRYAIIAGDGVLSIDGSVTTIAEEYDVLRSVDLEQISVTYIVQSKANVILPIQLTGTSIDSIMSDADLESGYTFFEYALLNKSIDTPIPSSIGISNSMTFMISLAVIVLIYKKRS